MDSVLSPHELVVVVGVGGGDGCGFTVTPTPIAVPQHSELLFLGLR